MTPSCQRLLLLIVLPLILSQCERGSQEEIVPIPDPYFLEALIELGVDKDKDGQISVPEAESTLSLMLSPSRISNLSGLEAFINLDSLKIEMNPLDGLDIRNNTVLRYLECRGCELSVLDVTFNPELRYLDCSGGASMGNTISELDLAKNLALEFLDCAENRISSLDLAKNTNLTILNCGRNQIQTLDVSANPGLIQLMCNNNLLTFLDVSNNQSLQKLITCGNQLLKLNVSSNSKLKVLGVDNMSTITEVCVWTSPFPPEGVVVLKEFSPNVYFTSNCTF
jgi:Leucine-rich repeat (LRR) protein